MTFKHEWDSFIEESSKYFKLTTNYEFLLFLIGIQELGQGFRAFSKQEKMDLITLAQCKLLAMNGYLKELAPGDDGWPQFESIGDQPSLLPSEKDKMLKMSMIKYYSPIISR